MNEEKSVLLISGDTQSWTDGTQVRVSWTCASLESPTDAYKASVRIAVLPSQLTPVKAIHIHLLERFPRSGVVSSDIRRRLARAGAVYQTRFDWNSTVNITQQELHISLTSTETDDEPVMMLKDPISKRFNFLLSFSG